MYCTVCTVLYVLYCMYCTVLHEGVCTAWSGELLPSLVYPEVGDPLGAGQDGAGRVPGHVVTLHRIYLVRQYDKLMFDVISKSNICYVELSPEISAITLSGFSHFLSSSFLLLKQNI